VESVETAVDAFAKGIRIAAQRFMEDPLGAPLIPNWNRVTAAFPNFFDRMIEIVSSDKLASFGCDGLVASYAPQIGGGDLSEEALHPV
jgi:hypothetical protein